jgi:SAM-dependent methyltransferase
MFPHIVVGFVSLAMAFWILRSTNEILFEIFIAVFIAALLKITMEGVSYEDEMREQITNINNMLTKNGAQEYRIIEQITNLENNLDELVEIRRVIKSNDILEISRDMDRGVEIMKESVMEWARGQEGGTLKLKGVTLGLFFRRNGLLHECNRAGWFSKHPKKIQILLLNPYSTNAITRSLEESGYIRTTHDPMKAICGHTLERHKEETLYRDFRISLENIRRLIRYTEDAPITIECKIYNTLSPGFLLINNQRAISETLIQGIMRDEADGKLHGILPKLIYVNGESKIKESLEKHFDYIWKYDSISMDDFHETVEEKLYEVNRFFLLNNLQNSIWENQWFQKNKGRSFKSQFDELYQKYKDFFPEHSPKSIIDLGCGDGGGGSLQILADNPDATIEFNDISKNAINLLIKNIAKLEEERNLKYKNYTVVPTDMLTHLNRCENNCYSLVHANFSIIYMNQNKATEIYHKVFDVLRSGGVFMISLWTDKYFNMPEGPHGEKGVRPDYTFERIPVAEDLRVIVDGSAPVRIGEIRRFYRSFEELLGEFTLADKKNVMDFKNIIHKTYENEAILRVWVQKK